MALKPTIYKFKLSVSDLNHDYFDTLNLTVALHPSETKERMMVRVLVFCLHAYQDNQHLMSFTKGLSAIDEPDIWLRGLDDQLHLWIDVGEPSFERIKKSCRLSKQTYVYSFNSKSNAWWKQSQVQFGSLPVNVFSFNWPEIQELSHLLTRTLDLSITLSGESAFVAAPDSQVEVNWQALQLNED
ncbi:YaeQ family protein [uncultured Paraglaciecola sp.]|uniref:YaeQ family protein n=1 Tax=uncultured Paraglaciecola sp. TaxID=1765024 RepID=UPI0030D7329F|tara:strand:+ start:26511 stop:27065 length:555 start_codon:yes stop_codon:yes gene_type:complete